MEPNTVAPPPDPELYVVPMSLRGMSVAAFSLGFFAMVVFWWFPLAAFFSASGVFFGLLAALLNAIRMRAPGRTTDARFLLFALGGSAFSALILAIVLSTYFIMRVLMRAV